MDVDNNEVVSPILNVHKVITAVTSNHMCHNRLFRKKVPVNAESQSSRVFHFQELRYQKAEIAEPTPE